MRKEFSKLIMRKKEIILLSLDTSSTATGFAIFMNGEYKESGEIIAKGVKEQRRNNMLLKLEKFIKDLKPDIIIAELPCKPLNANTQRMLTIIYGSCLIYALQINAEFVEKRPKNSRKYAVLGTDEKVPGKRKEIKEWAISFTERQIGKAGISDNEADAYIQGLGYLNWWKEEEKLGKIKAI